MTARRLTIRIDQEVAELLEVRAEALGIGGVAQLVRALATSAARDHEAMMVLAGVTPPGVNSRESRTNVTPSGVKSTPNDAGLTSPEGNPGVKSTPNDAARRTFDAGITESVRLGSARGSRDDEREIDDHHLSLSEEGDVAAAVALLGRRSPGPELTPDVAGALLQVWDEQRDRVGAQRPYLAKVLAGLLQTPDEVRSALLRRRSAREAAALARVEGHRRAAAEDEARARKAELWDQVVAWDLTTRIQTATELGLDARVASGLTPIEPDAWAVGQLVDAIHLRDRRLAERAKDPAPPPIRFRRSPGAKPSGRTGKDTRRASDGLADLRRQVGP